MFNLQRLRAGLEFCTQTPGLKSAERFAGPPEPSAGLHTWHRTFGDKTSTILDGQYPLIDYFGLKYYVFFSE